MKPIISRIAVVGNNAQGLLELLTDAGLDAVEVVPEQAPGKAGRIDGFIFHETPNYAPPPVKAKGATPNRYKPHQGKRERARRQEQIERGVPDGVRLFKGELQMRCRACDEWYESFIGLDEVKEYDPDYSYCGRSPRCCP